MTCAKHPESEAVAYCRSCGKPLCGLCQKTAAGTIYCEEHLPMQQTAQTAAGDAGASPYTAANYTPAPAPNLNVSPGLAFVLGLIPGVGAIYNGQYAKGLVHVIIVGLMISILDSGVSAGLEPLFGLLLAAFWWYMAFEAYHTAKKRQLGQPVDEFSSLVPLRGGTSRVPVAPVILIALGVVFLLNNLDVFRMRDLLRYWPVFLIVLGAYMLYARITGDGGNAGHREEASHERH